MATQGQVKWFDPKKGYGFIVGPGGQDVFVHFSQIQGDGFRSLKDGEQVEYELTQGEKGMQARTVVRLNPPPASARPPRPAAPARVLARPIGVGMTAPAAPVAARPGGPGMTAPAAPVAARPGSPGMTPAPAPAMSRPTGAATPAPPMTRPARPAPVMARPASAPGTPLD